jgi:phage/plasmid-associated DNA primase
MKFLFKILIDIKMIQLCDTVYVNAEDRAERLKDFAPTSITKDILQSYPYELLTKTTKLYFDYDENSTDADYIQKTRTEIRDLLSQHAGHFKNGFVFTESIHPKKVSFHVIFKKINIVREHFQPIDEQELFEQLVGKERFKNIDTGVYGKKIWFRVPYGTTKDKPYSHTPVVLQGEKLQLSDYLVSMPNGAPTKFYSTQLGRQMAEQIKKDAREYTEEEDITDDDKRKKYIEMLKHVKPARFKSYNMWLALMVFMKTHKLSRDLFIELSQASGYERFDASECIRAWNTCKENDSFGASIIYGWLKKDGVDVKKLFPTTSAMVSRILKDFFSQRSLTDYNISEVLYESYRDNLYYTTTHGWIHYNGKMWVMGDRTIIFAPIMELLTTELMEWREMKLKKLKTKLQRLHDQEDDEDEDDAKERKAEIKQVKESMKIYELLLKEINKLQTATKIKLVLDVAQGKFLDDMILSTFDMKPHWFAFKDQKAYDMLERKVVDISPTDRILTTCGYDFIPRESIPIGAFDKVKKVLREIIPEDEYDAFLSNIAVFLYGGNMNEIIVVWKGVGRNGKGLIATLLNLILGNYFADLPIEELTQESKGTGRASSELAQLRWARCVNSTEPDGGAQLITSRIKQMTGKDTMKVRHLHKECFAFVPKFTMLLQCNDMPRLSRIDEGIEARIKPQEFPYKFVEEEDLGRLPNYKLINKNLKEIISADMDYRNALLWMLFDAWDKSKGKYTMTERNKEQHQIIVKDNNPLTEFLENYTASESKMALGDLYDTYKRNGRNDISKQKFRGLLDQARVRIEIDSRRHIWVFLQQV